MPIVKNPHDKILSVNEALALGVQDIPDILLAPDFDRDKPEVILYSDREVLSCRNRKIQIGGDMKLWKKLKV